MHRFAEQDYDCTCVLLHNKGQLVSLNQGCCMFEPMPICIDFRKDKSIDGIDYTDIGNQIKECTRHFSGVEALLY